MQTYWFVTCDMLTADLFELFTFLTCIYAFDSGGRICDHEVDVTVCLWCVNMQQALMESFFLL